MNTNPPKRRLAKGLYRLSGKLSKIKVRTKTYRLTWMNAETGEIRTEFAGYTWVPNPFSMWLLKKSMRLDWDHWDHWATKHDHDEHLIGNNSRVYCAVCGGCSCDE